MTGSVNIYIPFINTHVEGSGEVCVRLLTMMTSGNETEIARGGEFQILLVILPIV